MSSLKRRARAVAMAAITDADVRRDPAQAFAIALGAARGFLASAIEARQRTDPEEGLDPKGESATGAAGDAPTVSRRNHDQ